MARPRRLIVFDTSVMLLLDGTKARDPSLKLRLEQYLEDQAESRLAVTAPGHAECHGLILPPGFECLEMTLEASVEAHVIWAPKPPGSKKSRQELKVDHMILATAVTHGANVLVTADEHMLELGAKMTMRHKSFVVAPLPTLRPRQQALL